MDKKKRKLKEKEINVFKDNLKEYLSCDEIENIIFKEVETNSEKKEWKLIVESKDDSLNFKTPLERAGKNILGDRGNFKLEIETKKDYTPLNQLNEKMNVVNVKGKILSNDTFQTKTGSYLMNISLSDLNNSISVKCFARNKTSIPKMKKGSWVQVKGEIRYDKYDKEIALWIDEQNIARDFIPAKKPKERTDDSKDKRIELHLHTKMSALDGVIEVEKAIDQAVKFGHKSIAITDHGVVQSFPNAFNYAKGKDIKIIYGMESYLIDDGEGIIFNPKNAEIENESFTVFDLETTGFNPQNNKIIEIGAVKIKGGKIVAKFKSFVNPNEKLSPKIKEITGIKDEDLVSAPKIEEVLPSFIKFIGNDTIVAHNLSFDLSFIRSNLKRLNLEKIKNCSIDTLNLSRSLVRLNKYKLNKIAEHFNIALDNHHRALDDAKATGEILLELFKLAQKKEITNLNQLNLLNSSIDFKKLYPFHSTILVKNQVGLKNLYKLVSESHIDTFYKKPRILKSSLEKHREGLLISSGCVSGEIYQSVLKNEEDEEILNKIKFYDYLEVQPLENNKYLIDKGELNSFEQIEKINEKIYSLGKKAGKLTVATGDVHYLNPNDHIAREILKYGQGFKDAKQPPLYYHTTKEMLDNFNYLNENVSKEIVVDNPQKIDEMIEEVTIIPNELYAPEIEGAKEEIEDITYNKAKELYGEELPLIVKKRIEKELNSIIGNGYAVIYLISKKLVEKSLEDGYLVGSRGSVGSSFVATLTGITEVNPLPPHYRCSCGYSEFITDGRVDVGVDLEDKNCPECSSDLIKDGFNIPFEVFLGFKGDKVPDIDLNFSGENQNDIHNYTEELFGKQYCFRAGTISALADKSAYGFAKNYVEEKMHGKDIRKGEINRLKETLVGVKKTTGQHPGGMIIVPKHKDIYDFTPIQKPANKMETETLTTHFDFHAIHDNLLKLDILGHDDPTTLKRLENLTGVNPKEIPLDDKNVMEIFSSLNSLNITKEDLDIDIEIGSLGVPEFNTPFVRGMLKETKPKTFADLIRISGLSHGTNVWLNNAQDLIKDGKADISEVISVRDDIMNYLILKGIEPSISFKIMEKVRKGKRMTEEEEGLMEENNIPKWYIDSCKKIKYMFPKAHATAYVTMAYRIAYFKVYHPLEFYTAYLSNKAVDFDARIVLGDKEKIKRLIFNLKEKEESRTEKITQKEKNTLNVLEVVIEALARGMEFDKVDIYNSDAYKFKITKEGKILPPFITIDGLGDKSARQLVEQRNAIKEKREEGFLHIKELCNKVSIGKKAIVALKEIGSLDGWLETDQQTLF